MEFNAPRAMSFGAQAALYDASRPTYPQQAVKWVLDAVDSAGQALNVVDLGAGTGKLTKVLAELGHNVCAVEPDEEMSALISSNAPSATVLNGRDTHIPVADGWADAVLVGQAWHWFNHAEAEQEIARALRPGGALGILWNTYDWDVPWVREFDDLLHKGDPRDASHSVPQVSWAEVREQTTQWVWPRTVEQLVGLAGSVSWIMSLEDSVKENLLDQIRTLAHPNAGSDGLVHLHYVTQAYRFIRP